MIELIVCTPAGHQYSVCYFNAQNLLATQQEAQMTLLLLLCSKSFLAQSIQKALILQARTAH